MARRKYSKENLFQIKFYYKGDAFWMSIEANTPRLSAMVFLKRKSQGVGIHQRADFTKFIFD